MARSSSQVASEAKSRRHPRARPCGKRKAIIGHARRGATDVNLFRISTLLASFPGGRRDRMHEGAHVRVRRKTVIAKGLKIEGRVTAEGLVELNGQIEGELHGKS